MPPATRLRVSEGARRKAARDQRCGRHAARQPCELTSRLGRRASAGPCQLLAGVRRYRLTGTELGTYGSLNWRAFRHFVTDDCERRLDEQYCGTFEKEWLFRKLTDFESSFDGLL
jgi:hypothetical protein